MENDLLLFLEEFPFPEKATGDFKNLFDAIKERDPGMADPSLLAALGFDNNAAGKLKKRLEAEIADFERLLSDPREFAKFMEDISRRSASSAESVRKSLEGHLEFTEARLASLEELDWASKDDRTGLFARWIDENAIRAENVAISHNGEKLLLYAKNSANVDFIARALSKVMAKHGLEKPVVITVLGADGAFFAIGPDMVEKRQSFDVAAEMAEKMAKRISASGKDAMKL